MFHDKEMNKKYKTHSKTEWSKEKSERERTRQCLGGIKKEQTEETVSVAEETWNEMKRLEQNAIIK